MKLWLSNIAPETSDEELKELVKKYAPGLECRGIQRVDGDSSRPAAIMEFSAGGTIELEKLHLRLNGMYWKGRALVCSTTVF